jgi:cyclic pyranopterin phosphate synthase
MFDSFGRELTYLRVSVTDRCNLRCVYCMPEEGVELIEHSRILPFERIAEIVRAATELGVRKVRLTGGEPLARKGLPDLVSMLAAIPLLETLAMTTNGTMLAPVAKDLKERGLDSVNISLDTLDPAEYRAFTRVGNIEDAFRGIDAALAAGFPVKINAVVFPDTSREKMERLERFAAEKGARMQFINHYSLDDGKRDDYEFDRPPKCSACDRLRLLADGTLRPCLHSDAGIPVDFSDIKGSILAAAGAKPERGGVSHEMKIGQIGG